MNQRPPRQAASFGPFRLLPKEQALYAGDRRIRLGSRAFEILLVLTEKPGEVVSKDELIARVWPNLHVGEGALRVHIVALRKALSASSSGEKYIVNVTSRGYCFVHPISSEADPTPTGREAAVLPWVDNLPSLLARLVGREDVVGSILDQLPRQRLVTIVGAGGIGKTTVAMAVVNRLLAAYPDGIVFVDLASVPPTGLVPAAIALALGLSNLSEDPSAGVIAALRDKTLLLVLDSCDRVVEGTALLVEKVLKAAPDVHVLATSREPLRAQGERVLRLPPLGVPPAEPGLTAQQAQGYPAVQLFVERALEARDDFSLTDTTAPIVADICRRLDGIALAIELVAGHVAAFDLKTLADRLDDRLSVLTRGRRTAIPRHQTMRAVIDWSFENLPQPERAVLRHLAVFDGSFDLAAAQAVAGEPDAPDPAFVERIADLFNKSLLAVEVNEDGARYRLLDTMRAYALERLAQSGEQPAVARRHAEHYLSVFSRANADWAASKAAVWLPRYSGDLGQVRTALDWAFSHAGDATLGLRLSVETLPLMFELSLAEECRRRGTQALSVALSNPVPDRWQEMRLRATLAAALTYTPGPVRQTADTWRGVLTIATELRDAAYEKRALWGLWTVCAYGGAARDALAHAKRFQQISQQSDDQAARLLAERIVGVSLHVMGQQQAARDCLEHMLLHYAPPLHNGYPLGFQINHALMAQATLVRIIWLQGSPDEALRMLQQVLLDVHAQNHGISICYVMAEAAIPIALMIGDLAAAERHRQTLEQLADQDGLAIWQAAARCTRLAIQAAQGSAVPLQNFHAALTQLRATGYTAHQTWLAGIMAEAPGTQGTVAAKLALLNEALDTCERNGEAWIVAELLRIKAGLTALEQSAAALQAARATLHQALDLARAQGARSWELRATVSLVRLQLRANHKAEARALLTAVLDRFDEGFATADLMAANRLLDAMAA